MKKLFMVFLFLLFLVGCVSYGSAEQNNPSEGPDNQNSTGAPNSPGTASGENDYYTLCSLDFLDENNGWIIQNNSQLLMTNDGGGHWNTVGAEDQALDLVKFISTEEGWAISGANSAAGSDSGGYIRYLILHTTDGGGTWTIQWQGKTQAETTKLDLKFFPGSPDGFAQIGSSLYVTHDGGKDWRPASFGTDNFTLLNMCFTAPGTGWVVGIGPDNHVAAVLHTTDGGETWERQFSTHEMSTDVIQSIGIEFLNDRIGWFTALDTNKRIGELYHTDDGGLNWEIINDSIGAVRPYPREIDFISEQVGWIPVDCGVGPVDGGLKYTCDGGENFNYTEAADISIDSAQKILGFTEINFTTEQIGWTITKNSGSIENSLLKTEDGGGTWKQVWP